jgi:hypothetical protein
MQNINSGIEVNELRPQSPEGNFNKRCDSCGYEAYHEREDCPSCGKGY